VSQALAALRLGYLSHKLRWVQDRLWFAYSLTNPDIEPVLHELDENLLGLSHRMNAYERSTVLALKERLIACHYEASSHCGDLALEVIKEPSATSASSHQRWREKVDQHPATDAFKKLQKQNWSDLRTIVTNVVAEEPRLLAWFEIGDQLGELIRELLDGRVSVPVPRVRWTLLYSGVDKLSADLRKRLEPLYPAPYRSASHLASQLDETYSALCRFAERRLGRDSLAAPKWDGKVIRYLDRAAEIRRQHNSTLIPILDAFERSHWPSTMLIPRAVMERRHDWESCVSYALCSFNKKRMLHLSRSGDLVSWRPVIQ
jgi:hypothetical protein